jgi:hypothetical protein
MVQVPAARFGAGKPVQRQVPQAASNGHRLVIGAYLH